MNDQEGSVLAAAAALHGHYRYETGHHGDLWLQLDSLFVAGDQVRQWAAALAHLASAWRADVVCGPLVGGAFLAQFLAVEIGAAFAFTERQVLASGNVRYVMPGALRPSLAGRRALIADDAVNAGSATLATAWDVRSCGAEVVGVASLIALGEAPRLIGNQLDVPFACLATLKRTLWQADDCALCRAAVPLVDLVPR